MEQPVCRRNKFLYCKEHIENPGEHHHERSREIALVPDHHGNDGTRDKRKEPDNDFDTQEYVFQIAGQGAYFLFGLFVHNFKYKKVPTSFCTANYFTANSSS